MIQLADGRLIRAQLAPLPEQHDDTGGHDSEVLRVAMFRTDLLVVSVQPRGLDVFELETLAELIERAQVVRLQERSQPLRVLAALFLADPGDTRDTLAALRDQPVFAVAVMNDRLALANAIEDAGIPRNKAQRVASVIFGAIHNNVATKADGRPCAPTCRPARHGSPRPRKEVYRPKGSSRIASTERPGLCPPPRDRGMSREPTKQLAARRSL